MVIAAGPRVENWPSIGVRAISSICAEMGLSVGQFGGESMSVRGVIPLETGGLVILEDSQKRIHRIQARSVVRVAQDSELCDPFSGWTSAGLIPISTAERLLSEGMKSSTSADAVSWTHPMTVILGSGNRAFRLGCRLLESGTPEVICIETRSDWHAKRFSGWEVEKRHFEQCGGKLIEATPIQLLAKAPLLWQLRVQDRHGIRVLDVGRVISVGPFSEHPGIREYPPGSFLFELEQTALNSRAEHMEGWITEEERGQWLAARIVKALVSDLGPKRELLERIYRRAKGRVKKLNTHRAQPFTPSYSGKWLAPHDLKSLKAFSGVPKTAQKIKPIASIECFEEIGCNLCQSACPTSAIQIGKLPRPTTTPILNENACTGCGLCLPACPSASIALVREDEAKSTVPLTLTWRGVKPWKVGEFATLVNRRGEHLGSARVTQVLESPDPNTQMVQVETPSHLVWEARGLKRKSLDESPEDASFAAQHLISTHSEKVEITLNQEKRWVRDRIPISLALFELGQSRPSDLLFCKDGSCGLCTLSVDGNKKLACQTKTHQGMMIRLDSPLKPPALDPLCACLNLSAEEILARVKKGNLKSPEAVISVTQAAQGKCHGQICMGALRRLLEAQDLPIKQWIDWRFPWSDWVMPNS